MPKQICFEQAGPRPINQYLQLASSIWNPFYRPELLETTDPEEIPYFPPTDSHWNHAGALRYLRAFLDTVDPSLAGTLDDLEKRRFPAEQQGDLGLKLEMKKDNVEIIAPKQSRARLIFENKISNEGSVRWFKNPVKNGRRAFILHDSFAMWLFGFIPEIFEEVLFFHGTVFDFSFVRQFNPTTVLCLQAERFLVRVPETGGDMLAFINRQETQKKAERGFADVWTGNATSGS